VPAKEPSYADGDSWSSLVWAAINGGINTNTGVFATHSAYKITLITDGMSHTYLVGERYMNPDNYFDGYSCDNDQGWDMGFDFDINRWTVNNALYQPLRDRRGYGGCDVNFGSAHSHTFNMAFCDGSVHATKYEIDLETNRRLGCRKDRKPIDISLL
jgi:prepilin-type processing-associated H-X9-DG protein